MYVEIDTAKYILIFHVSVGVDRDERGKFYTYDCIALTEIFDPIWKRLDITEKVRIKLFDLYKNQALKLAQERHENIKL